MCCENYMTVKIIDKFDVTLTDGVISNFDVMVIKKFMAEHECDAVINEATLIKIPNVPAPVWTIDNFISEWHDNSNLTYYRLADPESLSATNLISCYHQMHNCIHQIRQRNKDLIKYDKGHRYHLELLHYREGNYFGKHTHDFDPQCVGLILLLNSFKRDYDQGGTIFYRDNEVIEINNYATQGDLIIFRYDMMHEVTNVVGIKGRWVAVLPYY